MVVGPTLDFANICTIADKVTWTITDRSFMILSSFQIVVSD